MVRFRHLYRKEKRWRLAGFDGVLAGVDGVHTGFVGMLAGFVVCLLGLMVCIRARHYSCWFFGMRRFCQDFLRYASLDAAKTETLSAKETGSAFFYE